MKWLPLGRRVGRALKRGNLGHGGPYRYGFAVKHTLFCSSFIVIKMELLGPTEKKLVSLASQKKRPLKRSGMLKSEEILAKILTGTTMRKYVHSISNCAKSIKDLVRKCH